MLADVRNFAAPIMSARPVARNALDMGGAAPAYNALPGGGAYNALAAYGGPTRKAATALEYGTPDDPLARGIIETADELGMDPLDLATIISYETAGTFDPMKKGPVTQWGQHKGFIQFGEPQAREYGVDWSDPVGSQLGRSGAVVNYFKRNGWKPGMGMLDAYSIVNAGAPGRYNASDANIGGAPGTVADKVRDQMSGHRAKAEKLLGALRAAPAESFAMAPVYRGGAEGIGDRREPFKMPEGGLQFDDLILLLGI